MVNLYPIAAQTIVTKEKVNFSLDMNTDSFSVYLTQRFNAEFANLVCRELNFFVPMAFIGVENLESLKRHIDRRLEKMSEASIALYFERDDDDKSKFTINKSCLMVLDSFRVEVNQLINKKKRSLGNAIMTDSTDTSTDSNHSKSKKRKRDNHKDTNDFSMLRHKRQIRTNKNDRFNGKACSKKDLTLSIDEWSFSSDEYILPTAAELGSPCSSTARYDHDLYTIRRLDHFCREHLMLKDPSEIRKLQLRAQCRLRMHEEHLCEYLRFIRNNDSIMVVLKAYVEEVAKNLHGYDGDVRINVIIEQLAKIKHDCAFTNFSMPQQ